MPTLPLARAGIFALIVAAATPACDAPSILPPRAEASGTDARSLVAEGATLLDVRTAREYRAGHIEGAQHLPHDEIAGRLAEIPRDRPVVVYCLSGTRSAGAADTLRAAGYTVHDLGPMSAW